MKSMRDGQILLAAGLLMAAGAGVGHAATIIVEANPVTQEAGYYNELAGTWIVGAGGTGLEGTQPGSRVLASTTGMLAGTAVFRPIIPEAGEYYVDIAWPADANARNVRIEIRGSQITVDRLLDFTPGSAADTLAGQWVRLGQASLKPEDNFRVTIDSSTSTVPVDLNLPHMLVLDAMRFTTEDLPALKPGDRMRLSQNLPATGLDDASAQLQPIPTRVDLDALQQDIENAVSNRANNPEAPPAEPFTGAAATPAPDPFEIPIPPAPPVQADPAVAPPEVDPFAAVQEGGNSPFAAAPVVTSEAADPFAASTAPEADPFAAPADAPTVDPFASANPDTGSPFAAQPPTADPNPFDAPPVAPAPVAPEVDPFAAAPATSGPFSAPAPGTEVAADPFAAAPANVGGPFGAPPTSSTGGAVIGDPFAAAPAITSPFSAAPDSDTKEGSPAVSAAVAPSPVADPRQSLPAGFLDFGTAAAQDGGAQAAVPLQFHSDLNKALEVAKAENKPILLLFTGDTMASRSFERALASARVSRELQKFVLVRVEYRPNRELARRFAVNNFPYAVILNRFGYTSGHLVPTTDQDLLVRELSPYTQAFYQ